MVTYLLFPSTMICLRYHFVFADKSDLDTKSAPSIQLLQPKLEENKVMVVTRQLFMNPLILPPFFCICRVLVSKMN